MRLYTDKLGYQETIDLVKDLNGEYNDSVIFHCFWNGKLNQKHYISILSCFYTNVQKYKNRKIILWTNSKLEKSEMIDSLSTFCEIRWFQFDFELSTTNLPADYSTGDEVYPIYSDRIRYLILYKYGGVWFDLDCFFLKSLDTVFSNFRDEICVYRWSNSNYPNNAIFLSLTRQNPKMLDFISFMIQRNKGFGFQQSELYFDSPVDLTVLPCSWFDGLWCSDFPDYETSTNKTFFHYTEKNVNLNNFAKGAFCYHWHNLWDYPIEPNSYFDRLAKDLIFRIQNNQ